MPESLKKLSKKESILYAFELLIMLFDIFMALGSFFSISAFVGILFLLSGFLISPFCEKLFRKIPSASFETSAITRVGIQIISSIVLFIIAVAVGASKPAPDPVQTTAPPEIMTSVAEQTESKPESTTTTMIETETETTITTTTTVIEVETTTSITTTIPETTTIITTETTITTTTTIPETESTTTTTTEKVTEPPTEAPTQPLTIPITEPPTVLETQPPVSEPKLLYFVLNLETNCIHINEECSAAKKILPENRSAISIWDDELANYYGVYWACGKCSSRYSSDLPKF
ncbi:MAG: hypothetical protein K2H29_06770 [Oscillospiraceae bacterium]|nr:hypothetical protein [Oscillospiraceae bacterium]